VEHGEGDEERMKCKRMKMDESGSFEWYKTAFMELLWENRKINNENELSCTAFKTESG